MALPAGTRVGSYEILSLIGEGGMGQVYRARDTRLKRDVALKALPDSVAQDPDRVARFEREAELLATLNHPNIAQIYGLEGQAGGLVAIAMELVEGQTLEELLAGSGLQTPGSRPVPMPEARSPKPEASALPVADALAIARQIAEALEAAHERGVVHRDLKPANIKLTPDGKVKVLDFGLAKAMDVGAGNGTGAALSISPTLSVHATAAGVILGTAAYMSPEQARGKPVDRRTDVWAFGCVLYEMLTGRRAFDPGETVSDAIVSILSREPDWAALPADTPPHIRTLLRRCLQKDVQKRLPHVGVARIEIDEGESAAPPGTTALPSVPTPRSRGLIAVSLAAVAASVGFAVVVQWAPWRTTVPPLPLQLETTLGADVTLDTSTVSTALSADGTTLAFVGRRGSGPSQVYVRRLEQLRATPLSGTEGARNPFFSPDGRWLGFFSGGKLRKIAVTGGAAVTIADAASDRGGTWGDDGTIIFQPNNSGSGLFRVSGNGGAPEPVTKLESGDLAHRFPQLLPGGKGVLYSGHGVTSFDDADIIVQALPADPTKAGKVVQRGGYFGRYLRSGHLAYIHEGTLFVAPFDLDRLEVTGEAVPVVDGVSSEARVGGTVSGRAQLAVSETGTLVYLPGQRADDKRPIEWLRRDGSTATLRATPASWRNARFSPDGLRLAVEIAEGTQTDIWIYEVARDSLSRVTLGGKSADPIWTPDGRRLTFSVRGEGLAWRRADGTGDAQRLPTDGGVAGSWDPSGRFLAYQVARPITGWDVMILPIEGDEGTGWKPGTPRPFVNGSPSEMMPAFSPDGRWIAYRSGESGRNEIYVRPFPGPGGQWLVSSGGGTTPRWSRARQELFYSTPDGQIMMAPYSVAGDVFRAEKPQVWTTRRFAVSLGWSGGFDLHPDGDRLAVAVIPETQVENQPDKVVFVFNFFEELRRLTAPRR